MIADSETPAAEMPAVETIETHRCFGGTYGVYAHDSRETGSRMRFSVFVPDSVKGDLRPSLTYLAGLTCNEETFMIKGGALRLAAAQGLLLVAPDTSPRGLDLPGEDQSWDFGTGAGFYLDATAEPWAGHYRMFSYVTEELPALIESHFGADPARRGIFGHSMGGHGALVAVLRRPELYRSVSAFAPISNPAAVPWGEKAFGNYLGPDRSAWAEWDASLLMAKRAFPGPILIDQGLRDPFLANQLRPEALEAAAAASGQSLTLRRQEGYDHSYWFVQSFMADHLAHHAAALNG